MCCVLERVIVWRKEAWETKLSVYINLTDEKPSLEKQKHSGRRDADITHTDMRRLTTGIRFEKYVVRRFRRCANVIEYTYTNLDSIAYYTMSLYIAHCS